MTDKAEIHMYTPQHNIYRQTLTYQPQYYHCVRHHASVLVETQLVLPSLYHHEVAAQQTDVCATSTVTPPENHPLLKQCKKKSVVQTLHKMTIMKSQL